MSDAPVFSVRYGKTYFRAVSAPTVLTETLADGRVQRTLTLALDPVQASALSGRLLFPGSELVVLKDEQTLLCGKPERTSLDRPQGGGNATWKAVLVAPA